MHRRNLSSFSLLLTSKSIHSQSDSPFLSVWIERFERQEKQQSITSRFVLISFLCFHLFKSEKKKLSNWNELENGFCTNRKKKSQKLRLKGKCIYFFFRKHLTFYSKNNFCCPPLPWVNFDPIFIIYVQILPQECEACNEDIIGACLLSRKKNRCHIRLSRSARH